MISLKDKTVFVTGASAGIGASCAKIFAREGARLLLCARRIDKLDALAASLRTDFRAEIFTFELDVRDHEQVQATLENLPAEWKQIDILINNAGLSRGLDKLHEGSLRDWEEMIDTNVKGLLYVSRAIVPTMVTRGSGHVINIGSIAGHEVYPMGNIYCATKHAVNAITKGMRMDLVDTPLRVTTIDPGLVETEFSLVRFRGDAERAKKVYETITALTPDDVAEAALFAATRPAHVSINQIVLTATHQASTMVVHRRT